MKTIHRKVTMINSYHMFIYNTITKKIPKIVFGLAFSIIPIAFLVYFIEDKKMFRSQAIEVKYCYYWKNDSIGTFYIDISKFNKKEKQYQIIAYSFCPEYTKKGVICDVSEWNNICKVEVLSYTADSLLAKIRYKLFFEDMDDVDEITVYVPSFTLHDTVPDGYVASNEYYMKDVQIKK